MKAQREATIPVSKVKDFFPDAVSMGPRDPETGVQQVLGESGSVLGMVTQTAPISDKILGYAGPTNSLIVCDAQKKVIGLRILHSDDTPDHLAEIIRHRPFFEAFKGLKLGDHDAQLKVDAVSGATLTSTAIADGVRRRLGQEGKSLRFPQEIALEEVKPLIEGAASLRPLAERAGILEVLDEKGTRIGQVTRTSPSADTIIGYKGPTDTLVMLDAAGEKVTGIRLRKSFDTKDYVGYVTDDSYFLNLFNGKTLDELGKIDFAQSHIEGVSGATETSWSVAEGLKKRAAVLSAPLPQATDVLGSLSMKAADWGLLGSWFFPRCSPFPRGGEKNGCAGCTMPCSSATQELQWCHALPRPPGRLGQTWRPVADGPHAGSSGCAGALHPRLLPPSVLLPSLLPPRHASDGAGQPARYQGPLSHSAQSGPLAGTHPLDAPGRRGPDLHARAQREPQRHGAL